MPTCFTCGSTINSYAYPCPTCESKRLLKEQNDLIQRQSWDAERERSERRTAEEEANRSAAAEAAEAEHMQKITNEIRNNFADFVVISQSADLSLVEKDFREFCISKNQLHSHEGKYADAFEFSENRAAIYRNLISDYIISNPNSVKSFGVIKKIFEEFADRAKHLMQELVDEMAQAEIALEQEKTAAEQEKKDRIAKNLENQKKLTDINYECSCGYVGTMGITGKKGHVYVRYYIQCPNCDEALTTISPDKKILTRYRWAALILATCLIPLEIWPAVISFYGWAAFAPHLEGG